MTRPHISALLLAGAIALVVSLAGCTSLSGTGEKGFVSGDGQLTVRTASEREQPISLEGDDLEGEPLDLADLRGLPVVVVVWGDWCGPCRAEAPDVVAAAEELQGEAEFVGLNIRDPSVENAQAFVRTFDIPYRSFYSPDGKALLPFSGALTPRSIPGFAVLDANGRIAASINGELPSTQTLVDVTRDVADETAEESADG